MFIVTVSRNDERNANEIVILIRPISYLLKSTSRVPRYAGTGGKGGETEESLLEPRAGFKGPRSHETSARAGRFVPGKIARERSSIVS